MVELLRRYDKSIDLLDQRALPAAIMYLPCTSGQDVVDAIKTLAVRGAPAIGVAGQYGLWLDSLNLCMDDAEEFFRALQHHKETLKHARPTAVNLAWAIDRSWRSIEGLSPAQARIRLRLEADRLYEEERHRNEAMAAFGAGLLTKVSRVLTHCNTGSLATVGVGTALGVIRLGYEHQQISEVFVDETRPLLQGARLTAWELLEDGIPATLITDSMAATLMAQGFIDAVLVGADRIALNGDTANKIGTYSLAVLAHYHRVPFYVVAPLSTIDPRLDDGSAIPIEERPHDEVRRVNGHLVAPSQVPVYNPAFDVTPGTLVTAIVTDRGVARAPYSQTLAAFLHSDPDITR